MTQVMTSPPIRLKPPQWTVFTSDARFQILVAGRRFRKTFLSLIELCRAAWYVAPTYKQAKSIAWKPLKLMTRPYWACRPNETDLRIELRGGGAICLRGADNYDSLRGEGLDFLILDEYASIDREGLAAGVAAGACRSTRSAFLPAILSSRTG